MLLFRSHFLNIIVFCFNSWIFVTNLDNLVSVLHNFCKITLIIYLFIIVSIKKPISVGFDIVIVKTVF